VNPSFPYLEKNRMKRSYPERP